MKKKKCPMRLLKQIELEKGSGIYNPNSLDHHSHSAAKNNLYKKPAQPN